MHHSKYGVKKPPRPWSSGAGVAKQAEDLQTQGHLDLEVLSLSSIICSYNAAFICSPINSIADSSPVQCSSVEQRVPYAS